MVLKVVYRRSSRAGECKVGRRARTLDQRNGTGADDVAYQMRRGLRLVEQMIYATASTSGAGAVDVNLEDQAFPKRCGHYSCRPDSRARRVQLCTGGAPRFGFSEV